MNPKIRNMEQADCLGFFYEPLVSKTPVGLDVILTVSQLRAFRDCAWIMSNQ